MANILRREWSPVRMLVAINGALALLYVGLIAVVMTYAALEVEFANHVRNDEAAVATLESSYLDALQNISATNYVSAGYAKPTVLVYVPSSRQAALNVR